MLKCNITVEKYGFEIVGESGQVTKEVHDTMTGLGTGFKLDINEKWTYTNSKNTYNIVGTITVDQTANAVSYDVSATGGAFGETAQTCKK